ncbi:hypothetical protein SLS55_000171 [Diplodia seriata]|uniref:Uncharacterized protein n=1 Tax=Diplodia seriata TaxID=420778 RepID=A0ABR3CTK0_9PEZI
MAAASMAAASSSTTPIIGRDRSVSDAAATHNVVDDPRPPEAVHLPRSASYTYFPPVKDLEYEDSSVVELKGRISEAELHSSRDEDSPYSSSGGSTPENEPADPPEEQQSHPADPPPQRSRLSRFFSSSREPVTSGNQVKEGVKDKNTRKDPPKEPSKQLQKQPPKEVRKESQKNSQQENSKQISKQAQKPAPNQTSKEASRDTSANAAQDAPKLASKEASKEAPKESQQKAQSEKDKEGEEKEKTDRAEVDQQAVPPKRSLTHLRRKSWVSSSAKESSPSKSSGEDGVNGARPSPEKRRSLINTSRRKSILRKESDPPAVEEERAERPAAATRRKSFIRKESEGAPASSEDRLSSRVSRRMSILRNNSDRKDTESSPAEDAAAKSPKKGAVLTKRPRKPSDAYIKPVKAEELPPVPALPEIPKSPNLPRSPSMPASPQLGQSFSTDRLPTLMRSPPSQESVIPPVPRTVNHEKLKTFSLETPKKKDELWGQFRSLDGDYQKFVIVVDFPST